MAIYKISISAADGTFSSVSGETPRAALLALKRAQRGEYLPQFANAERIEDSVVVPGCIWREGRAVGFSPNGELRALEQRMLT